MTTNFAEIQATLADAFDSVGVIMRASQSGWKLRIVTQGTVWRSHHETLAEAKASYLDHAAQADHAKWEIAAEAAAEAQANRYWEEGTSAQQMAYQAELDAEAQHLGWDPMVVGAFGPDYN